jgi:alpha-beta hydrolase superfamily lysophospholipase
MKKKWIPALIITVLAIAASSVLIIPRAAFKLITDYKPYSHEMVLNSSEMCADFGISNCRSPEDYGYNFVEHDYRSLDSLALNGWFVPAKKKRNKCIVLIHGRTSNRLKTMKFLALVDSLALDTAYNVFIPDLRNSGKSAPAKTYMGYKFGEDLTATLLMLKQSFAQDTIILYGFSMGAMAIGNALGRSELRGLLEKNHVVAEKIILDSPLANVKETLRDQSSEVLFGGLYFSEIFRRYSESIDGFGEQMRLSKLLPTSIPVLILQSKDDQTTLNKNLEVELNEMQEYQNLDVVFFEGPDHVRIFQDERTRLKYLESVENFLADN